MTSLNDQYKNVNNSKHDDISVISSSSSSTAWTFFFVCVALQHLEKWLFFPQLLHDLPYAGHDLGLWLLPHLPHLNSALSSAPFCLLNDFLFCSFLTTCTAVSPLHSSCCLCCSTHGDTSLWCQSWLTEQSVSDQRSFQRPKLTCCAQCVELR